MALISIDSWQPFPDANGYSTDNTELRVWYSRSFIDSDGISVQGGTGTTGFYITSAVTITSNVPSIASFDLRTTLDAIDPAPQSIQVFARLFSNNVAKAWIFAGNAGPTGWVIPNPTPLTSMTYEQLAIYNQTTVLANPPLTFWTAAQVQAYFDSLSPAPDASDVTKGITKLSISPRSATNPIAWGFNDPSLPSGFINVKGAPYYAAGDGTTDDTAALQAALDAGAGVAAIFIPRGTYKITSSLTASGISSLWVTGAGDASKILNAAPASNPTLVLDSKQEFTFENFSIISRTANPNDAIKCTAGASGLAFGTFRNLLLNPNGKGIYLHAEAVTGINTLDFDNIRYWPSGFGNGAQTPSAGVRLNAILADGIGTVNDITITGLNSAGEESIADGGAAIRFDCVSGSARLEINSCEIEGFGAPRRSVDISGVDDITVSSNFLDNTNLRFLKSRQITIIGVRGGGGVGGTTYTFGDGTAPNAVLNAVAINSSGSAFTADANCFRVGAINSTYDTAPGYNNLSTSPVTINVLGTGSVQVPDQLGYLGIEERGRSVPMGEWTTRTFSAGNYTASAGNWTLASGDVITDEYQLVGKTMTYNFRLDTTTISTTPNSLKILIPGSFTAAKRASFAFIANNNGGAYSVSEGEVLGGDTHIFLYAVPGATSNWAAGTDNSNVRGSLSFEIQ